MATAPSEEAWRRWFEQHGPRLLLFARQQTRSEADAEDVLQEACVRVWRRGVAEPDRLRLAFAHIRRAAIDLARRNARRQCREEIAAGEDTMTEWFTTPGADAETAARLEQAVRALPAEQQAVLTLKIWGELTFAEIAGVLDIPVNTAASRYRLALEHLRRHLPATMAHD